MRRRGKRGRPAYAYACGGSRLCLDGGLKNDIIIILS